MSIRRQSCDPCFASRRKCDLAYPVCTRCERNNKGCHYKYPPQVNKAAPHITIDARRTAKQVKRKLDHGTSPPRLTNETFDLEQFQPSSPRWLGPLGKLAPISLSKTWNWVFSQIRHCPQSFAESGETIFIHKNLYVDDKLPQPLLTAFGICTGTLAAEQANQQLLFRVLDSEMVSFLTSSLELSLRDELYKLQAIVLYQIMRLFYGQIKERIVAERQEYLVRSYALKLLQMSDAQLRNAPRTWETWILAESIRRTVYIAFKLYTSYAVSRYGQCSEIQAMNMLPISTKSVLWYSSEEYALHDPVQDEVLTYKEFADFYGRTPRRLVEPFERLIIVGCKKRIEQVDWTVSPRTRVEEVV